MEDKFYIRQTLFIGLPRQPVLPLNKRKNLRFDSIMLGFSVLNLQPKLKNLLSLSLPQGNLPVIVDIRHSPEDLFQGRSAINPGAVRMRPAF